MIKKLYRTILQILTPTTCAICGEYSEAAVCEACILNLPIREQNCLYCSRRSPDGTTCHKCKNSHSIEQFYAPYKYRNGLKKPISKGKIRLLPEIFTELAELLTFKPKTEINYVTSIPSNPNSTKPNHAEFIAQSYAKKHNLTYKPLLNKTKETNEQKNLPIKERKLIKNIYKAQTDLKNANIIIIDDIITTGSTIKSATIALKKAGANQVFAISLCSDR